MSIGEIEAIRARSAAARSGPWVTDYAEMCRKTVARRHSKVLPMSTDLDDLVRRDDDLYDMQGAREEAKNANGGRSQSLVGRLDALASPSPAHDAATGEITEQASADALADEASANGQKVSAQAVEGAEPRQGQQDDAGAKSPASPASDPTKVDQAANEIELARLAGAKARREGMSRKALPPEYRDKERATEANAWGHGWDNSDDVLGDVA